MNASHSVSGKLTWSPEQDAQLLRLKRTTKMSLKEIGRQMHMTKGQIAGRVYRFQQRGVLSVSEPVEL